jgi:hypothetical protein
MTLALNFTSKVLGSGVADKLKLGGVLQTVRSRKGAAPFLMKQGSEVPITLDGQLLYRARITDIKLRNLGDLTEFDAELGGFDNLWQLKTALRRAGFRFRPLGEYEVFAIQFQPVKGFLVK